MFSGIAALDKHRQKEYNNKAHYENHASAQILNGKERIHLTKAEQKFIEVIRNSIIPIGFAAVAGIAFLLRWTFIDHITADWYAYMAHWIDELKEYPGISGIGHDIGEYYVPYMLFLNIVARTPFEDLHEIKLLSILFDYVLAFASIIVVCGKKEIFTGKGLAIFFAILMSPIVRISGSCFLLWKVLIEIPRISAPSSAGMLARNIRTNGKGFIFALIILVYSQ